LIHFYKRLYKMVELGYCRGLFLLLTLLLAQKTSGSAPCVPRSFGHSSHVCVCNSTYCDQFQPVMKTGSILHVESDKPQGKRFFTSDVSWQQANLPNSTVQLQVDRSKRLQTILGFGGAFTDAAGINIASLSTKTQENLISAYFGPTGIEYNTGRINMGGCDFSDRQYTYCDVPGDVNLTSFNLTHDDNIYKIPYIKMAKQKSRKELKLMASPWSAPAWMKSNNALNGMGYLLPEYYQSWANYFVKFLDSYKEEGIEFWGVTSQNEPLDGNLPDFSFNCMGWTPKTQTEWIAKHLGPTLHAAGYESVKLMAYDDQRIFLRAWVDEIMANPEASKYVSGWAIHWYLDFLGFAFTLDQVHNMFPDKFILYTEACTGSNPWDLTKVLLGSWERGQMYVNSILESLNHWSTGWTDWNLALSMSGGPNWADNQVDSPIIVNPTTDEFYKNPMYYAMGHFSKFIPENSQRIGTTVSGSDSAKIQVATMETPENTTVIVLTNRHRYETVLLQIVDGEKYSSQIRIGPESVHTLLWKTE